MPAWKIRGVCLIGCALLAAPATPALAQTGQPPEGGTIRNLPSRNSAGSGRFVGIGVELDHRLSSDGYAVVRTITPQAGEDAKKALRPGDKIARMDGKPMRNVSSSQVVALMRGEEGKPVRFTLLRADAKKPVEVSVKRRMIYAVGEGPAAKE